MEPKFSVTSKYTKDLYIEYSKLCNNKLRNTTLRLVLIGIAILIIPITGVIIKYYMLAVAGIVLAILCPAILSIRINNSIRKAWETNDTLKDADIRVDFYDDKLIQKSANSETTVEYSKVYRMFESENVLAIMIATNQGIAIDKRNCSEEAINFIKSKITA